MKTPKIIDEDMAQKFSANSESALGYFEEITDAAAESLSRYEGEVLNLSGLTSLTDAAAKSLSKHKGRFLSLSDKLDDLLYELRRNGE
jgi:uncharacterized protein YxjI